MNGFSGKMPCGIFLLLSLVFMILSCSGGESRPARLSAQTGFFEIEPIRFSFQQAGLPTLSYASSKTRILYSFYPADADPADKPLFVFFNGGPGCATCTGLFSMNTAPHTLDKTRTDGNRIALNPISFTALGNLLYLDAPNTGFSYNVTFDAADEAVRRAEFGVQNFNPYIDAAQMVRAVLRFLAGHPPLKANRVILIGESYGGVRASVMLNLLLFHDRYEDGSRIYRDAALAREIRRHFLETGSGASPADVARQFAGQILISPLLAGVYQNDLSGAAYEQAGSVIYNIAAQTGTVYTPCADDGCNPWDNALTFVSETAKRDVYQHDQPASYTDGLLLFAVEGLNLPDVLSFAFERNIVGIPRLGAPWRPNAYKQIAGAEAGLPDILNRPSFARLPFADQLRIRERAARLMRQKDRAGHAGETLADVLGPLHPWDAYVLDCNDDVAEAFYVNAAIDAGYTAIDPLSTATGELFLQNLALVETLITNAALDLIIYAPVIPDTLKKYPSLVRDVVWRDDPDNGRIEVYYQPGAPAESPAPASRIIAFPRYPSAGHMVTHGQPEKFFADVRRWLSTLP